MTREEQNTKSKEAIITAAVAEFGRHGYEGSSLNTALNEAGISKGKIYHYFESKDQVYLACVSACFDQLMERLQGEKDKEVRTLPGYFQISTGLYACHFLSIHRNLRFLAPTGNTQIQHSVCNPFRRDGQFHIFHFRIVAGDFK